MGHGWHISFLQYSIAKYMVFVLRRRRSAMIRVRSHDDRGHRLFIVSLELEREREARKSGFSSLAKLACLTCQIRSIRPRQTWNNNVLVKVSYEVDVSARARPRADLPRTIWRGCGMAGTYWKPDGLLPFRLAGIFVSLHRENAPNAHGQGPPAFWSRSGWNRSRGDHRRSRWNMRTFLFGFLENWWINKRARECEQQSVSSSVNNNDIWNCQLM